MERERDRKNNIIKTHINGNIELSINDEKIFLTMAKRT